MNESTQTAVEALHTFFWIDMAEGHIFGKKKNSTVNDSIALIMLPFSIEFSERWRLRPLLLVCPAVKFTCQNMIFFYFHHLNYTAIGISYRQVEKERKNKESDNETRWHVLHALHNLVLAEHRISLN